MPSLRDSRVRLLLLAFLALAARLAAAPSTGYAFDVAAFKAWTAWAAAAGLRDLYTEPALPLASFPNYALLFYVYGALGAAYRFATGGIDLAAPSFTVLVKLPGILGDVVLAWAVWRYARRIAGERGAFLAASLTLFHPAIFYVSAVWGQVDSVHTALLVLALDEASRGRHGAAWWAWTAAALTKLQSVAFFPLLAFRTWRERGPRALAGRLAFSAAVAALVLLPFAAGHVGAVFRSLVWNASRYPYLTMNAMNVWWPLSRIMGLTTPDTVLLLPLVNARLLGALLFLAAVTLVLAALPPKPGDRATLAAAAALALAFFLFPTEMHERYLYPAIPLLTLFALLSRAGWALLAVVSGAFLVNLVAVLPLPWRAAGGYTVTPTAETGWVNLVWIALLACLVALVWMLLLEKGRAAR